MGLVYVHWTNKHLILTVVLLFHSFMPVPLHYTGCPNKHLILTVVLLFHSYMGPFALYLENLKGVFAKNERGYRLNAIKKRF